MGTEDATVYRADEQMQLFTMPGGMENRMGMPSTHYH